MAKIKITLTIEASSHSLAHAAIDAMDAKLLVHGGRVVSARLTPLDEAPATPTARAWEVTYRKVPCGYNESQTAIVNAPTSDEAVEMIQKGVSYSMRVEGVEEVEQSDQHERMSDHEMNVALVHALPEYKGWTAAWEYPGFLAFHRKGSPSVFATPDYHTRGEISVEVTTDATGHTEPRPNINWSRIGRTPEAFMALMQPVLDNIAPFAPSPVVDEPCSIEDACSSCRQEENDEIFEAVMRAMQPAEERGGPEGAQYVALMERIAHEAQRRANTLRDTLAGTSEQIEARS